MNKATLQPTITAEVNKGVKEEINIPQSTSKTNFSTLEKANGGL